MESSQLWRDGACDHGALSWLTLDKTFAKTSVRVVQKSLCQLYYYRQLKVLSRTVSHSFAVKKGFVFI